MSQTQTDIDSLLAQAEALAAEPPPAFETRPVPEPATARPHPEFEDPTRILRLQVPVIVRLAERTMPLADIVGMSTGAIIEFDKPVDGELDLLINNKCIGKGHALKVGENFGLRVTVIGSIRDRIHALGGN